MHVDIDPHVQHDHMIFTYIFITFLITTYLNLAYCKPQDPVSSNNRCTLYDTIFYKPEDDPMGSKHVALLVVALF